MSETQKLAAIPVADVVGYSRLAGSDEDGKLARLRGCAAPVHRPPVMAASSSAHQVRPLPVAGRANESLKKNRRKQL
jgi:hypothetical protein